MSTLNQKCVIKKISEKLSKGKKIKLGKILRECGYSQETSMAPTRNVIDRKGFQELLNKIDDKLILNKWKEWAISDKDKRISMEAGKELMKLKDRYPSKKIKISAFEERDKVVDGED